MEESADLTTRRAQTTLRRDVQPAVFGPRVDLTATAHHVHGEPKPWADVIAAPFEPFPIGERWGAAWETTWFRFTGTVPAEWRGAEVVVRLGLGHRGQPGFGAEGLVWEQGTPIQGISSRHDCYHLFPKAEGGEAIDVLLEAAANPIADLDLLPAPSLMPDYGGQPLFRLDRAEAVVYRRDVQALAVDMGVLLDLLRFLPADQPRAHEVRRALNLACNALDPADVVGTAAAAREVLADVLSRPAMASAHTLTAVGNAHIDTAWLWPLRETIRKAARTFSSALRLMDEYDDYHFACSQPQQLAWVKERYPELFARIKAKVATGQFEPVGSMWVEPDCNVTSGESLVRQILHGSLFWQEEFGIETGEVWLPDVFGYSASMPQIMRRAGIHRFLTQKLSWSTVNKIPNHTLWWEGIDGSRVFAHFPPAETYGGNFDMAELDRAVRNFRDHGRASRSLYLFGWGDGGGGPTREMIERAHRYRDLEGAPRVALADVNTFWADAEADVDADELAVWAGELYLEYHRGTYTTSAMSKRENRTLELLLREAELWSSVSGRGGGWASYPAVDLDQAWKDLLLLQFHDVLPGTSIHWVYEDSAEIYARVRAVAEGAASSGAASLLGAVDTSGMAGRPVAVCNSASHDRSEVVVVADPAVAAGSPTHAVAPDGTVVPVQVMGDGMGVAMPVDVPALGYAVYDVRSGPVPAVAGGTVAVGERSLENELVRVVWDEHGTLRSVWDKAAKREVVQPGQHANLLQLFDDRPVEWDAWDINAFYDERGDDLTSLDSVEVVEAGPLLGSVRFTRSFGASRVTQTMVLRSGSPRIDFVTDVDWHEDRKLLKVAFPIDVHARRATFEIQYGHVERPTHRNTSWDTARFEVCAHKWVDVGEPGYGAALLNDCKYGHDVQGSVLRLSLLRAPSSPDPFMDRGTHRFTYSLFPHSGDFREAGVIDEAYALNLPMRVVTLPAGGDSGAGASAGADLRWGAFHVDTPGVIIESVKRAERADAMIVRLYEAWGRRTRASISAGLPVRAVRRTDLLEHDTDEPAVELSDGAITLDLHPFEIVTLRYDI